MRWPLDESVGGDGILLLSASNDRPTMVEGFFFDAGKTVLSRQQQQFSGPIILLSGPPSSGKTSLLFQFAYNAAEEIAAEGNDSSPNRNLNVVFICNRRKLESNPPVLSQGINPSSETFERIQMKYLDDEEGVSKYFAAFHLHHTFPAAVIIDDFGDFFDERRCQERYGNSRGTDLAMVRILALCHNAVMHANQKGRHCKLLLSDTHHGDSPRLLFIYKRWVSSIFSIQGDGKGSFLLKSSSNMTSDNAERMRIAKYSIALQYLVLKQIIEDEDDKH